jgi:N-carbamoylputrescine amidase
MASQTHYTYEPNQYVKDALNQQKDLADRPLALPLLSTTTTTSSIRKTTPMNMNMNMNMKVAAIQLETISGPPSDFLNRAELAVVEAVQEHGANLVLLQELFQGPYFCQSQEAAFFSLAQSDVDVDVDAHGANGNGNINGNRNGNINGNRNVNGNVLIERMKLLAKRLQVVLPISLFERKNNTFYNSVIMIDADGTNLGTYRKTHIPDGTGYQEKFYFSPGDTGFQVFRTKVGAVGVGICWDQWFPETARSLALLGADVLLFPTAIGSEPQDPGLNSADHWQRVMQGHAAANMIPVVASNRFGTEILLDEHGKEMQRIAFFGRSFITDEAGAIVKEAKNGSDIISAEIDVVANRSARAAWGLFRDRRPEMYGVLRTKDGHLPMPM